MIKLLPSAGKPEIEFLFVELFSKTSVWELELSLVILSSTLRRCDPHQARIPRTNKLLVTV